MLSLLSIFRGVSNPELNKVSDQRLPPGSRGETIGGASQGENFARQGRAPNGYLARTGISFGSTNDCFC
jgi:hypothetical protein